VRIVDQHAEILRAGLHRDDAGEIQPASQIHGAEPNIGAQIYQDRRDVINGKQSGARRIDLFKKDLVEHFPVGGTAAQGDGAATLQTVAADACT